MLLEVSNVHAHTKGPMPDVSEVSVGGASVSAAQDAEVSRLATKSVDEVLVSWLVRMMNTASNNLLVWDIAMLCTVKKKYVI